MRLTFDPGHGGEQPGAVCFGTKEKDINLQWTTLLGWCFDHETGETSGYTETRYDDRTVSLDERVAEANSSWEPDAFLSLHCNSNEGPAGRGFEIFHYPGSVDGKDLAERICEAWPHPYKRGVKSANYKVLRETKMPAVLIEVGFINHTVENGQIQDLDFAMQGVKGILDGAWDWCYGHGHR